MKTKSSRVDMEEEDLEEDFDPMERNVGHALQMFVKVVSQKEGKSEEDCSFRSIETDEESLFWERVPLPKSTTQKRYSYSSDSKPSTGGPRSQETPVEL